MQRASLPDRDSVPAHEVDDYDRVLSRQAKLWEGAHTSSNAYFGALLNSPPLASTLVDLGRLVREGERRGYYSNAERELVDVVFSVDFDYNAILYLHLPDIIACGVRVDAVDALRSGDEHDLNDSERQLVDYARRVVRGEVTDEVFAALATRLGQQGAVAYTVMCGFLLMTFRLWMAIGVPEVPAEELDALLEAHRAGTAATVHPDDRVG